MARTPLKTLVRSWNPGIVGVMQDQMRALAGYRLIFDDLVLKSALTAHLESEKGEVWEKFGVAPKLSRMRAVAGRLLGDSPFAGAHCHGPAPTPPGLDASDNAFSRLRQMMWNGTGGDPHADFSKMGRLSQAYDLTLDELDAVGWYSSPQAGWRGGPVPTTEDDAPGQRDVVRALTRAIRHMPSLRDLGVRLVTFRVVGGDSPSVRHLKEGTIIQHGVRRMKNGSHHFMSTSITPNVKGFAQNLKKAGEMLAICGTSGRYIQWLGRHSGAMDGDEVLYPPGTVTRFHGHVVNLDIGGVNVPLYLLVECDPTTKDADVVDDFKFAAPTGADDLAAVRKTYATSGRIIGEEVI